jgi:SAM-dependent methyltransferase
MNPIILKGRLWALNQKFLGGRKWYQYVEFGKDITTVRYVGRRGIERTKSFTEWFRSSDLVNGSDVVLDLGCNAAWLSVVLAEKAKHVKGVEIDSAFARQARFVLSYFNSSVQSAKRVTFFEADINKRLDLLDDVTVLLASKFLYHRDFAASIEDFMQKVEESNIRLIIVQGHTTQGALGNEDGARRLLARFGFDYHGPVGGTEEYPIGVAKRKSTTSKRKTLAD